MGKMISVTDKIKSDLARIAEDNNITQEGLACVLLRLSLSDEQRLKLAINLIKSCSLGGVVDLERKGW